MFGAINEIFGKNAQDFLSINPFETFNKLSEFGEKSQKFIENNMKFQKAQIAYHQAIYDMLEAVNDNAKILSNKK